MKFFASLLSLLIAGQVQAAATFAESATSSIQVSKDAEGRDVTKIITTNYEVYRYYTVASDALNTLLLKKTTTNTTTDQTEGSTGHLRVEVRKNKSKVYDQLIYAIDEEAHEAATSDDDLLITWLDGCCATMTGYRAYNIITGKLLLAYDENTGASNGSRAHSPLVIDVPNTSTALKRFIGVSSPDSSRDFVAAEGSDKAQKLATLTYASMDGKSRQVDVYGPVPEGWSVSVSSALLDLSTAKKNEVMNNKMTLWSRDGVTTAKDALNDFAIKLSFSTELSVDVMISVVNDNLDLDHAILPAGYRLVRTK